VRRRAALAGLAVVPVAVLLVFFVVPVSGMVERGFRTDGHWDPVGVLDVLGRDYVRRAIWFTVWTSASATAISVALGLPAAYALYRLTFPGGRLLRAALLVPFVLPTVVVGVAFRELLRAGGPLGFLGLDGTPGAILAGMVFFNVAVVIRAVGAAWESLDRRPAEAAAALGAPPFRVFRTVTWPALRPAVISSASVVFLFCASAFGIVLTLGGLRYSSVETQIYLLTTDLLDLQGASALSIVQLLAVTVLLVLAARLRRVADPTAARSVARPRRPLVSDAPALAVTALLVVLVALPLATLLVGSLRVDGGWSLADYHRLASPGADDLLVVPVLQSLWISLRTALGAMALSLTLGLSISLVVTRRMGTRGERRVLAVLDGLFMLPLGVSAVTLGFGLLVTLDRAPFDFRSAPWLVAVAQALVALPLVVRTLAPVLLGIDDRQRQAAASLGAGPLRRALVVDVPVMARPLLAAAGFAFATSLGEFGATSFLARPESPTLPVVIYRLLGRPGADNYGTALAASVVLAAVTALVVLLVDRLRVPSLGAF